MGIKFSKQGQGKVENLSLQHHLMNYLSKKFYIRNLVSKQRRRMLVAGYDLDMSYITDHILAMSFPAERMRAMYRNPLWQVKSVLDMRHQGHYKIYNLCIEESYDPSHFHGRVESFPFDDNHVPPLQMIKLFCENVSSWISSHPKNIAVIHCMAGKGRTGLMVCAYLVYCGMSVEDALHLYAQRRTTNNEGVSIPSQRRYVGYWAKCLSFPKGIYNGSPEVKLPIPCRRELQRIRLYDTVNTESIFFVVSESQEVPSQLYRPSMERTRSCCRQFKSGYESSNSPRYFLSFVEGENEENKSEVEPHFIVQMDTECSALYHKTCLDYNFEKPLPLTGDVRIIFYAKMFGGRLFYACFNSAFIKNSLIQLRLQDLDKVGKKGRSICGPSFCLELVFGPANAKHSFSTSSEDECPRYDSS
ncbi:phosphatidylinositol 3,4,5-trisphosphate 3-phosphatase and protein-tyrosine-phosphatase PTEN1-like isoform X1 [Cucurbita moschata]|uniref:Phosphatidylinositol 3,4,5-trisphosphate 3-phosphatase and protein-tyrosine-phosphatase PTEN1-like isoform X1 n=1 Tax=Cucurbita moschata TaxID=3662 RepID=A0A6J1F3C4_CUCMO|nr:phosphatidylinositol 3,4,5-trisphosphate 3-phosphatase and protein-tyrosine-phosphatase PTEN1-like isoform X1 [Cucurbita moschata]XP_022934700.1 phosphatidylinositol 3,4,5-trisphosphate 3-phosphatase and protein-tyrosine-phosphatase PTEN1-like isoform X1 [Cucurbita moschata]